MAGSGPSLMGALGFGRRAERLYDELLPHSGRELVSVADALLRTADGLREEAAPLVEAGVVRFESSRVLVLTPVEAVAAVLSSAAESSSRAAAQLQGVSRALPHLTAPATRPAPGEVFDVVPLDGEISSGGNPVPLLRSLIEGSVGDLLWLRPDQFARPREDAMAEVVGAAIARGRASRAIYPVRAWSEARDTLELRASVGEQIRLVPELPSRLFVIGTTHAVLPEPLGFVDEPRSLVRQQGLVQALTRWFEELWARSTPVPIPGADTGDLQLRGFLVQQLAQGAKDEQIARTLGISLRTVRRRVATMMAELGVDSRFQAGVEAVRRGWI